MTHPYFDSLGVSDPLIDTTDEAFAQGEPPWPAGRQQFRVVRTWQSLIIATEGLAPLGAEVYVEIAQAQGWLPQQARTQWQMHVLTSAAKAVNQGLLPLVDASGNLTDLPVAIPVPAPPSAPLHLYGQIGGTLIVPLLVGVPVPGRALTRDGVAYVPLTPITPGEFDLVRAHGPEEVVRVRQEAKVHHVVVDSESVTDTFLAALGHRPG